MKIILFTPYPPTQGGGSQNLRSAIPHLKDVEIIWTYLAPRAVEFPNSVYLGSSMLNGGLVGSWANFIRMSLNAHPGIPALADRLLELQKETGAERFWCVEHYESLAVADALISKGANIHLSVHDDPPFALVGRSRRYFPFVGLCEAQFARVLRGSGTVETTSWPMGVRYLQRYGVKSTAYFPYIKRLPIFTPIKDNLVLRVGFLGTLYTPREPRIFAQALALIQKRTVTPVEFHFWGLGARQLPWVQDLAVPTVIHPFTPEAELIDDIVRCNFFYLNYPFDRGSWALSQFSHCAKLSTYLKAQRPLFTHTPLPSSIADFVSDTGTGVVCTSQDPTEIAAALQLLLLNPIPPEKFAVARTRWYGEENLKRLNDALLGSVGGEATGPKHAD